MVISEIESVAIRGDSWRFCLKCAQDACVDRQKPSAHRRRHFSSCPFRKSSLKNARTSLAVCPFPLILIIFLPFLFFENSLFVLFPALHPFTITLPYFSSQFTSLSFPPCHPSSFFPSLSLPHKPAPPSSHFPHRSFSFFSTILSVYPLHLPSTFLLFLSSSVSGSRRALACMEIGRFVDAVFAQTGAW